MNNDSIYNPKEIGPFDKCLRCFSPLSDNIAYCTTCGKISTVFSVSPTEPSQTCAYHNGQPAIAHCCLCSKPICTMCNDNNKQHFSIAAGCVDLHYCVHCTARSKEIEKHFFDRLLARGECAKHPGTKSIFKCVKCALPLCGNCSYFQVSGLIRRRIKGGPYCLACFRSVNSTAITSWVSGAEALERSLVKG